MGHNLHIYKAKFFPRLVRSLINTNLLELEGKVLLDPFVGSGTALLEALLMGLPATGIDLDPLCVAMSQAKLDWPFIDPTELTAVVEAVCDGVVQRVGRQTFFPQWDPVEDQVRAELPAMIAVKLPGDEANRINKEASAIKAAVARTSCEPRIRRLRWI